MKPEHLQGQTTQDNIYRPEGKTVFWSGELLRKIRFLFENISLPPKIRGFRAAIKRQFIETNKVVMMKFILKSKSPNMCWVQFHKYKSSIHLSVIDFVFSSLSRECPYPHTSSFFNITRYNFEFS